MCGICGRVADGVTEGEIERMSRELAHRGPDDRGVHIGDGVGLGHRRLSIIDLATGHQPISTADGSLWIVLNGEIYNYRELRTELADRGHVFHTSSDTEVLLHLYQEYGENCVTRLRGMFAFAIWDARRRRLFAARDHLGQKPFFFVERAGELLFASEIKALLALDPRLRELDREALDQYLALRIVPAPRTFFRDIRKLPPAHTLSYEPGGAARIRRYWDVEFEPKLLGSDDELLEATSERIVESLRFHSVSDVPIGAFLSGGLDSTLIVALLAQHVTSEPIRTFAGSLPYAQFDEAPFARLVADRYQTVHVEEQILPSLTSQLVRVVGQLDEPTDALCVCVDKIAEVAARHVKVVLGGDGGDELFGGYDRYAGFDLVRRYTRLPEGLRRTAMAGLLAIFPEGRWYRSPGHRLRWLARLSALDGSARYAASLGYFFLDRAQRSALYGPELRTLAEDGDPEEPVRRAFESTRSSDPLDCMVHADWQTRLPGHSVMILDRMTMAHGLEARSPFLDHELVEFAARLPTRTKLRRRKLRVLQTRLARRHLPKPLLTRPKQGFSSALPYMLRDEYRTLSAQLLEKSYLADAGLLRQDPLIRLVREHEAGGFDHASRLWLLLNAELWYRLYIAGVQPDALQATLDA